MSDELRLDADQHAQEAETEIEQDATDEQDEGDYQVRKLRAEAMKRRHQVRELEAEMKELREFRLRVEEDRKNQERSKLEKSEQWKALESELTQEVTGLRSETASLRQRFARELLTRDVYAEILGLVGDTKKAMVLTRCVLAEHTGEVQIDDDFRVVGVDVKDAAKRVVNDMGLAKPKKKASTPRRAKSEDQAPANHQPKTMRNAIAQAVADYVPR